MRRVLHHRDPADRIRVTVQELRRRVDGEVRSELERPLEIRRRERVVDDDERSALVRDLRQQRNVAEGHHRVRGGLEVQHLRVRAHRGAHRVGVRGVYERELDAVSRLDLREVAVGPAVRQVRADDVIARLHERGHGGDRCHPGGEGARPDPRFEHGDVLLESRPRRVLRARVLVALVPSERLLHVRGRLVDRDGDRSGAGIRRVACVNRVCREAHSSDLVHLGTD